MKPCGACYYRRIPIHCRLNMCLKIPLGHASSRSKVCNSIWSTIYHRFVTMAVCVSYNSTESTSSPLSTVWIIREIKIHCNGRNYHNISEPGTGTFCKTLMERSWNKKRWNCVQEVMKVLTNNFPFITVVFKIWVFLVTSLQFVCVSINLLHNGRTTGWGRGNGEQRQIRC